MRTVRWQYKKVNSIVHTERDEPRGDVTTVTVHDKQSSLGFGRPSLGLERALHPLECVAIGRPATVACSKAPVVRCISWNPAGVGVLRLEDQHRRQRFTRRADTLDRSYPLLPAVYNFPARLFANIYKYPRRLAGTHCKSRFVYIVDSFWWILVLQEKLGDSVKPPLDRFGIDSIVPRAFYLACPGALDIWMTFPEAIKSSLSDRAP